VFGSDGLFDNIFDEDILASINSSTDWNATCWHLANSAILLGQNRTYRSPFIVAALEKKGLQMLGGKLDDTTVVISLIEH
jgi:protein phosphatase PTC7